MVPFDPDLSLTKLTSEFSSRFPMEFKDSEGECSWRPNSCTTDHITQLSGCLNL